MQIHVYMYSIPCFVEIIMLPNRDHESDSQYIMIIRNVQLGRICLIVHTLLHVVDPIHDDDMFLFSICNIFFFRFLVLKNLVQCKQIAIVLSERSTHYST